ncbi:hypothetical protein SETIT_7G293200v2 [Setaria italica]|uniref:Uncharacterized protein n=1 Tax=Setaria italica TaxID=4555 RepID=A0A368S118_SETIT|nr:hypothetical protein SETIT_7G293200v2 [Setaria italica]
MTKKKKVDVGFVSRINQAQYGGTPASRTLRYPSRIPIGSARPVPFAPAPAPAPRHGACSRHVPHAAPGPEAVSGKAPATTNRPRSSPRPTSGIWIPPSPSDVRPAASGSRRGSLGWLDRRGPRPSVSRPFHASRWHVGPATAHGGHETPATRVPSPRDQPRQARSSLCGRGGAHGGDSGNAASRGPWTSDRRAGAHPRARKAKAFSYENPLSGGGYWIPFRRRAPAREAVKRKLSRKEELGCHFTVAYSYGHHRGPINSRPLPRLHVLPDEPDPLTSGPRPCLELLLLGLSACVEPLVSGRIRPLKSPHPPVSFLLFSPAPPPHRFPAPPPISARAGERGPPPSQPARVGPVLPQQNPSAAADAAAAQAPRLIVTPSQFKWLTLPCSSAAAAALCYCQSPEALYPRVGQ